MHFGDAPVVARDEAVEDLGEKAPFLLAEAAGNAEVDGNDAAAGFHEEIAGMHVGVEETVAQRVAQERLDQRRGDRLEVVAGIAQARDIGHLDALDPVHGDDVAPGALPVDRGNAEARIVARVLGEFG